MTTIIKQLINFKQLTKISQPMCKSSQSLCPNVRIRQFHGDALQIDTNQVVKPSLRIIAFDNESICYNTDLKSSLKKTGQDTTNSINKFKVLNTRKDDTSNNFQQISCDNGEFETVLPHRRI